MPDAPAASPEKTSVAPAPVATAPKVPRVQNPTKPENSGISSDETDVPETIFGKARPLTIGLGGLSVVLFVVVVILGSMVSARNTSLVRSQNRIDQAQAAAVVVQAKMTETESGTAVIRKQADEAKASLVQLQAQLVVLKEKAAGFQTQMEEAKVASIRHQGEVEVATSQATLFEAQAKDAKATTAKLQTQLDGNKTAAAKLQVDLDESRANALALQTKLTQAESQIVQLQKPPAKK